ATAPLITGKRAVVYVQVPDPEKPTYAGREVLLGPRLGDFYVVESGLAEGDHVVTRGAFKLDAELQIHARPSMMSMPSGQTVESGQPAADDPPLKPQTLCPVMGGKINREMFTDYHGMRIYFCCAGCEDAFLKDPEGHLEKMRAEGVQPEKRPQPQTRCPVMGNPVNKEIYADYEGQRIYFCCAGCDSTFLENPGKYLKQMSDDGIVPEKVEHGHAH
ncbi:MAG TPA: YHS domain-containing protein, partial [Pontiella sp.]|nr:YHS domain-containing protein [Pontiella sp.]